MEHERAQQQSGNAITGDAQRQQRDHSGANDRVVGRFGGSDALQAAFAELFGVLGSAANLVVAEELCHTAADTGHCTQHAGNGRGTQAGGQDADHFFLGDALLVDLAGVVQLAAGDFEITQFLHHLGQSDKSDHGGQHINAVFQSCRAKGEAGDAGDGVHTDAGHQQADHTRDEALGQAAAGDTGDQADAHDAQGEVLHGGEVRHQLGDEGSAEQQQHCREQAAEHGSEQRGIQCLFHLTLFGQRVAIERGGDGGVGARGVQGNGGNGAAVHAADVNGQQQDDGGSRVIERIGQGQHQDDAQGNAQAGHAANDHAQNQTAEDEQHVVNSEHLRDSLRNQCKIRHQMIPPNRPRAGSEMLKTFLNSRKMAKAETRTTM